MSLNLSARPPLLWTVRILSFSAMIVCFVLLGMKLSGSITSVKGCGGEGGCGQVMGGRWSEWFHTPVTLWAGSVYGVILLLTLERVREMLGRTGDQLLAAAGVVLAGAAVYFISLMLFANEDGGLCPWCLGLHAAGLTVAVILLTAAVQRQREGERGVLESATLTGFAAIGILAAGQIWGPKPDTHLITKGGLKPDAGASTNPAAMGTAVTYPSRVVSFFGGDLKYDAAALPILGKPDAQIVLVEFFDYTCSSCRIMSGDLRELKKKWPGVFSVVVLPTPLNRSCNPFLRPNVQDHQGACELAKLSLAMWKAKPEAFADFHEYLLTMPLPIGPERLVQARKMADAAAGAETMRAALEDGAVISRVQENIGTFARLTASSIVMPKLLLHADIMLHGPLRDTASFLARLEQEFGLGSAGRPFAAQPK